MRINVFLTPDDYTRAEELARMRGYSGPVARFLLLIMRREIAHADLRLDRGIPDVSPTRKHARELPRVLGVQVARGSSGASPRKKPLQTSPKVRTNSSERGPQ